MSSEVDVNTLSMEPHFTGLAMSDVSQGSSLIAEQSNLPLDHEAVSPVSPLSATDTLDLSVCNKA